MSFVSLPDDHSPEEPDLFLDTSIPVSMHKGSLFVDRIKRVHGLFRWKSTSSYAKTEYGNVILANAEYVLRQLRRFNSFEKTCGWIANVLLPRFRDHAQKQMWTLNLLRDITGMDDKEKTECAILSLTRLLKLGVRYVDAVADEPIENGTDCYWAKQRIREKKDGELYWENPKCTCSRRRCKVDTFFEENKEVFLRLKAAIDQLPVDERTDQLQSFSEVIAAAVVDPRVLLDYKTGCKRLADAIIAVDSRNYHNLFSMNAAESSALTAVLGKIFTTCRRTQRAAFSYRRPP